LSLGEQPISNRLKSVAAYAAASKATVLSNYLGLTAADVDWCCDASPLKQGRLIPGSNIPIVAPTALRDTRLTLSSSLRGTSWMRSQTSSLPT